ncbi:hypothetical protein DFR49_1263 [Hephaestia caeni]|uniref:Uncharacterized protein n=1 Tax=Hephaestia caeni TaxID=645617 RepID=A0A397PAY5_9SPHN|nr:hypothetical protein [Hephaestia caeni]RIA46710.1 hypothetical protein DFR49_1263 [Hephaestia caeni]
MSDQSVPFENRWTSGEEARHWMLRLEREGVKNVRAMYADHELNAPDKRLLIEDVPIGFARDWLAWHQQSKRSRRRNRHRVIVVLLIVVIIALAIIAWRIG